MTDPTSPLAELPATAGDGEVLRAVAESVVQLPIEADVEGMVGARRHERTPRKTSERAVVDVIQEAWIGGVATSWSRPWS